MSVEAVISTDSMSCLKRLMNQLVFQTTLLNHVDRWLLNVLLSQPI